MDRFDYSAYSGRMRKLYSIDQKHPHKRDPRFGWLIETHELNPAAFRATEMRSSVNAEGFAFVHPMASTWCCDDTPSPWKRVQGSEKPPTAKEIAQGWSKQTYFRLVNSSSRS